MKRFAMALAGLLALTGTAFGVNLGDTAPALNVKEWIVGSAVNPSVGDDKTIYVVEFWATWCPPCRRSIPHLKKLHEQYTGRNVVILGLSNEKADVVKPFVEQNKMTYHVGIVPNATGESYGVSGIPHAFVVDAKGKIIWEGHPMQGLDEALEKAVQARTGAPAK